MTLTIRHATLSNVEDEGIPGEIGPDEWNEGHAIVDGNPIVILATGQSNFVQRKVLAWSPEARARIWNYNDTDGNIGTAFVALQSTTINVVEKFASEVARLNPTRTVYVIKIAIAVAGNHIGHWLPGAPTPDEYQNILNNITPALAAIGTTKIDLLLWWQGEDQTAEPYKYPVDWETVHGRFLLESWFPRTTPVIIFGVAPTTITGDIATDITNGHLQTIVRADPDCRRFVYTGSLGASYWLDAYHPTGAGYDQIGKMAAAGFVYGAARDPFVDPVRGVLRAEILGRSVMRNLLIGGDFMTNPWQRGTSFVSAVNASYTADRFQWSFSGTGAVDINKTADAPTIAQAGIFSQHCLDVTVTSADTSIGAADLYLVRHRIEGLNMSFLGFGQSGARPITVSFWVKSSVTGTYYVSLRNQNANRSHAKAFQVSTANAWERKALTFPGDTTGTWEYDNQIGLIVTWVLAVGSNSVSTPNTWNANNTVAGGGQVNAMGTIGDHFKLALIQVEEGVGASPFEALPQDILLDRCRRYYRKSFTLATAPAQNVGSNVGAAFAMSHVASTSFGTRVEFDSSMRTTPTVTTYNPSAANANWRDVTNSVDRTATVGNQSESGFTVKGASGAADADHYIHWQAVAEL